MSKISLNESGGRTKILLAFILVLIVLFVVILMEQQRRITIHKEQGSNQASFLSQVYEEIKGLNPAESEEYRTKTNNIISTYSNPDLAYIAIIQTNGQVSVATGPVTPGRQTVPARSMEWGKIIQFRDESSGQDIIEIYAPLKHNNIAHGFIGVAFYDSPSKLWPRDLTLIGSLITIIILIALAGFAIIYTELKRLTEYAAKLNDIISTNYSDEILGIQIGRSKRHKNKPQEMIESVQKWIDKMKNEVRDARTSILLGAYRQEKAEAVLHALPYALMIIDEECQPTFANARAEHLLEIKSEFLIGKTLREWCKEIEVQTFLMKFRNAPTSPGFTGITYIPTNQPDKRVTISVHALVSPRDKNTLLGRLVLFRDITEEYLTKQSGLEFVTHAAHELKTPLATLTAYSENLLDYLVMSAEDRVHSINIINEEARRMASLINNLLNIAKLDAGSLKLSRSRVKINDLLQDAYETMLPLADLKNISMQLRISPDLGSARLDKDMLRIAIDNVLGNAIKYSDNAGEVIFNAELLDNDELQITVKDRGIGISRLDCARIFDKHFRANTNEATSRPGHGLGLYLARQIIELHHGRIAVESEIGKGTTFIINLKAHAMSLEGE